jgi:TRAP-type C4-dicarboxylate transport system permease small subunit
MAFATTEEPAERHQRSNIMKVLRATLDGLYRWSGYLAAASMVAILAVTVLQIVTRYAGINIRGLSDYAGYFMAASAFMAFPLALNRGAHVRIELLLGVMGRFRRTGEGVALAVSALVASWFAFYACKMVYVSWQYGDLSTGLDATPLWIPQCTMAFGAVLFAVAITDQFMQLIFTGSHSIDQSSGID